MTLDKQVRLAPSRASFGSPAGQARPAPKPFDYSTSQLFEDAFLQENTLVSGVGAARDLRDTRRMEAVEGYDPFDHIEGTIFELVPEALIDVDSPREFEYRAQKLEAELARRETISCRDRTQWASAS